MPNALRTAIITALVFQCASLELVAQVTAAPSPAAPLQQARAHLAARRYAEADSIMQQLVKDFPQNPQLWLVLGNARRGLGRTQDAAAAFLQAHGAGMRPPAASALFLLHADANDLDAAAAWLDTLRALGAPDLSGLAMAPEARNLRADARFAILFPDARSFERPFTEDVKIIHEWRGEAAGDEFGWIARSIGDVDGDSVADAVVSATQNQTARRGRVYVYSGKTGRLLWKKEGEPRAVLGLGLEAAGDVNRDGVPDVAAGAPGLNAILVLSGKDGAELLRLRGDSSDVSLGDRAAGIGDLNGDGHPEIIGSALNAATHGPRTGRVHVFSGKDGSRLLTLDGQRAGDSFGSTVSGGSGLFVVGAAGAGAERRGQVSIYRGLDARPAFVRDADQTGAALGGMFSSIVGDVDGDGADDVYASDFVNSAGGRAYVFSGKTGATLLTLTGEGGGFGIGAANTGDVNGDGRADLVIGSWQFKGAAWSGGRVQLFSGSDGRLLRTITGRIPGETLGFDAVGIGDVNADGAIDYLVTSAWSMVGGPRTGRVFILSGK